jgi:transposase
VVERSILELRPEMSISTLSNYFDVDWRTVKDIEKRNLKKKYASVPLSDVKVLGVDEIYVGKKKYKTVVCDLESGCVLHVGDGKGGEALDEFGKRLSRSKADVETIAMDMSSGFSSWFCEKLPEAEIVFDHFHVIKLMNDKLEKIRRRVAGELDDEALAKLKKTLPAFENVRSAENENREKSMTFYTKRRRGLLI